MKRKVTVFGISLSLTLFVAMPVAFPTVKAGANCTTIGQSKTISGQKLECKKQGDKRTWTKVPLPTPNPTSIGGVQILMTNQRETILNQTLAYPISGPAQISSAIITLASGEETGWHRHDAPLYAHILSGVLQVTYDGGIVKVYRTGDSLLEALGTYHNGQNLGKIPVRILVVNMGAVGVENTVKKI